MMKILDCTLRDGGYYTNWDFEDSVINKYVESMNHLPVEYIEIGYRNNPETKYLGKCGYCPIFLLEKIRQKSSKRIAVMLNEKTTTVANLEKLLTPVRGLVDMVRLAVDPLNFDRAITLAENIKKMGFEVGFNMMYMSKWQEMNFIPQLKKLDGAIDVFCMVDSYGSISPDEVKETILKVKKYTDCKLGFHGHNNLELGLVNALIAIENGVEFIDATILGMGRGAGNLKTELLLAYLNKHYKLDVDFNVLSDVITVFTDLQKKYEWGTSLPYMLSGANSLPQKEVMEWVSNRMYSFNSIVRALDNKTQNKKDNAKYPVFEAPHYKNVIIIGGGDNALIHFDAIKEFVGRTDSIAIVHASARYAAYYDDIAVPQYFCLNGSEGRRLKKNIGANNFRGVCILPPYPRIMGTDVPESFESKTFEIVAIQVSDKYGESCTTLALQIAYEMQANNVYLVGYDGYQGEILSEKERDLTTENRVIFSDFISNTRISPISLTPTLYVELELKSIYQFL